TNLLCYASPPRTPPQIYTLSLHDALPISHRLEALEQRVREVLGDKIVDFKQALGEITIELRPEDLLECMTALRDEDGLRFNQLRSEEHTSELQSRENLVCRLLLEKKYK